jgi:L-ascorbate metabolism protein UlaG (beta-lactamase superfamily)
MGPRRIRRVFVRIVLALLVAFVLLLAFTVVDGWTAFGRAAQGERRARMERSLQWHDGVFENPQPLWNDVWGMFALIFSGSDHTVPDTPVPFEHVDPARFAAAPPSGLRITWLGHSSMLLEQDGHRILTDPVWGERTSPVGWAGPERWYAPPLALDDLPPIDAVLISHDHYDHLDLPTITAIAQWDTTFLAPLGVAEHLVYWGVPEAHIVELDWWEETTVGELRIVCTPARHASGRTPFDQNTTLWASYALLGPRHRVWFSGDTGLFPALREIGERLGPFDLTMIEVGAYGSAWPDWHLGPEQAVTAHTMVRGDVMLPVHWGLFDLAYHGWTEPIERVLVAAERATVQVIAPRPGQSIEPSAPPPIVRWWPEVPWQTAEQDPIVATKMDDPG